MMGFTINKKRIILPFLLLALAATAMTASASAVNVSVSVEQKSNLGIIKGIVRDEGGSPIADASVAIFRSGTTRLLKQVSSAADGRFLAKILPGKYTVLAVAQGFNPTYLFGVDVGRSSELTYGFKLERAGSGNTLPEKRLDRNSSRWRIKAAQMHRAIYQNREGEVPTADDVAAEAEAEQDEHRGSNRKGQTVVETYVASTGSGVQPGINFATLLPVNQKVELVIAGQSGVGDSVPQRIETGLKFRPVLGHQISINSSINKFGNFGLENNENWLGQVSVQAIDEWRVRDGVILVFGFDYSKFIGAGSDSSISPRIGLQYDIDSRTRFRTAYTSQTEEKSWANAIELEGFSVGHREPVAIEDLVFENGKPRMNKSSRLEFGVERIIDSSSSVEANVFFDSTIGRGVGLNRFSFDTLGGDGFADFVGNQQGRATGLRLVYARRLSDIFSTRAGYSFGSGQRFSAAGIADPANLFENDVFHTVFGQIVADLKTGTSVRTVYKLSSQATIFAIDPFRGHLAVYDPGLSIYISQAIPTLGLPFKAEAVVDARNLFDFQTGIFSEDGGLRANLHKRMFRGGIQVRF